MKKEQARVDTDVPAIDDQTLYRLLMSIEVDAPANEDDFIKSLPLELVELFEKYQNYKKVTLEWGHGATPKFCIMYVELIDLYHHLSRAVRTGNHVLNIHSFSEIIKLFSPLIIKIMLAMEQGIIRNF